MGRISLKDCIGPAFYEVHNYIKNETYSDYYLTGGRASLKSSFPSIEIVKGIIEDPLANAMAIMKVGVSIETGVFAQFQWAIDKLGLEAYFKPNFQKYYFTYLPTGQKIFCKGCDEASKFKSIKLVNGYFKYQWFEELDAFDGMEEVRKVQQSLTRAGLDTAIRFYCYNPPKTMDHWVNKHILNLQKAINEGAVTRTLIHHSTYLQVPPEWLGKQFIQDAETLKATNPMAYEHEYLGKITGTGGQVFSNVKQLEMTPEVLNKFGAIKRGLDWGFAVDPTTMVSLWYDRKHKELYIYDEIYEFGISFDNLARAIKPKNKENGIVRADSAEPRSNNELVQRGINIAPARKGPGSVDHGIKWLQGLNSIFIDSIKCPNIYREFVGYEHEKDKAGNFRNNYPDKNNHTIDATRYALEDEIGFAAVGGMANF